MRWQRWHRDSISVAGIWYLSWKTAQEKQEVIARLEKKIRDGFLFLFQREFHAGGMEDELKGRIFAT